MARYAQVKRDKVYPDIEDWNLMHSRAAMALGLVLSKEFETVHLLIEQLNKDCPEEGPYTLRIHYRDSSLDLHFHDLLGAIICRCAVRFMDEDINNEIIAND